jgi:glycosyltransferase involved in cell wall biosynthesis
VANIAIDARPLSGRIDGIARYTFEITKRIIENPQHKWFLYSNKPLNTKLDATAVRVAMAPAANSVICSQILFPAWAKEDAIDVFWTPRHHLPLRLECPSMVTIHDLCWIKLPESMPILRRISEGYLTPRSIQKAERICVVSRTTAKDLESEFSLLHKPVDFVPPGLSKFSPMEDLSSSCTHPPFILNVATIEPRKNHKLLLQAFAKLIHKIPHQLVLIGNQGWGNISIPELCASLGLQSRVTWISNANDRVLANCYAQASLYVSSSLYEGFNMPLLEAMSFNLPIVATDIPIHREVIGGVAFLANGSPTSFANTIEAGLRSNKRDESQNLVRRKIVESYSWAKSAQTTTNALESIIKTS